MSSKRVIPNNTGKTYKKGQDSKRVVLFKKYYTDPQSDTFDNVLQSALRAGYSQEYSENITNKNPRWFQLLREDMSMRRASMLAKAEKNLDKFLEYDDDNGRNKDIATNKLKASIYVTETVGKEIYSKRQELTGKEGKRLFNNESKDATESSLSHMFKGVQAVEDAT